MFRFNVLFVLVTTLFACNSQETKPESSQVHLQDVSPEEVKQLKEESTGIRDLSPGEIKKLKDASKEKLLEHHRAQAEIAALTPPERVFLSECYQDLSRNRKISPLSSLVDWEKASFERPTEPTVLSEEEFFAFLVANNCYFWVWPTVEARYPEAAGVLKKIKESLNKP